MRPHRQQRPLRSLLALAAASLAACGGAGEDGARRPNVVLLVVDTLRADMVAPVRIAETPGFDRLFEDAVGFSQAFSHAPMTLPSHAALFSARAPFETGVLNNWQDVREDLPLLAEWLQRYGYQTHAVVSLGTLNPRSAETALTRGFDTFDREYWNMDVAPVALERMRRTLDGLDPDRPFFLFAHFSDPHAPYNAHAEEDLATADVSVDGEPLVTVSTSNMTQWSGRLTLDAGRHVIEFRSEHEFKLQALEWTHAGRYLGVQWEEGGKRSPATYVRGAIEVAEPLESDLRFWIADAPGGHRAMRERYLREVEWMDRYIGEFVDELRARGHWEDTILVFTSDHGEALGERGFFGHVEHLHDEMLHVPLAIKPPAGSPHRARLESLADRLVPQQDLVPTVLDLAVVPPLPGARGVSLLDEREPVLIAQTHRPEAKRDLVCLRDEQFKMVYAPEEDRFELYDLVADPREKVNVFDERRSEREQWVAQLRSIADLATTGAMAEGEVSAETRELLDALGYGGGE